MHSSLFVLLNLVKLATDDFDVRAFLIVKNIVLLCSLYEGFISTQLPLQRKLKLAKSLRSFIKFVYSRLNRFMIGFRFPRYLKVHFY